MSSTTPYLGLTLYDSTTDQAVTFATFRAVWGGPATTSNFYKIDTGMSGFNTRITNLEDASGAVPVPALFSSSNFYIATGVTGITAYNTGQLIVLSVDTTSDGTVTLDINSLGTKSCMKVDSTGTPINLTGSDLVDGRQYLFIYDGTRWLWVSANSADQIQIVGTPGNLVTVGSTNNLLGTTPADTYISKVTSPSDNAVARFDGTGGNTLQNSSVFIDDVGSIIATGSFIGGLVEVENSVRGYGIAPVQHGYGAGGTLASPTTPTSGDLLYGIGSRPYEDTATWTEHSTAALHWIAEENISTTNHGTSIRFVVTPIGTTQANRITALQLISNAFGEGSRIRGDFGNSTQKLRTFFQNITTNGATGVGAIPNGTHQTAQYTVYNNSDPTNASYVALKTTVSSTRIESFHTGSGSDLDLGFYVGDATTPKLTVTTVGNSKVGGTASRGTTEGTSQLVIFDGTPPAGTLTNGVSLYSTGGELAVMDSNGVETLLSSPSGTYTPTLTIVANLDAVTPQVTNYSRVGTMVTLSGSFFADATSAGTLSRFRMSIPFASDFTDGTEVGGNCSFAATNVVGSAIPDTTNKDVEFRWTPTVTSNTLSYFILQYRII